MTPSHTSPSPEEGGSPASSLAFNVMDEEYVALIHVRSPVLPRKANTDQVVSGIASLNRGIIRPMVAAYNIGMAA